MTQNALDLVQAIQSANLEAIKLPRPIALQMADHLDALQRQIPTTRVKAITLSAWATTVVLLRRDHETGLEASARLAKYLRLHAERWGDTPTLANLRKEYLPDGH